MKWPHNIACTGNHQNHKIAREMKNPSGLNGVIMHVVHERDKRRPWCKQGKENQTPCGVGCCTGAVISLACPCTSIFCFLIGLGRIPAVPALELTDSVGGPIPLPYPFVVSACGGGGGCGGGCAANPVGSTAVCNGTPCCTCNFASLLSSFLFFRSSRA